MLNTIPTDEEMIALIGQQHFDIWVKLTELIDTKYEMEQWRKALDL